MSVLLCVMNTTNFIGEVPFPGKSENAEQCLRHLDKVATGNCWEERVRSANLLPLP